jgi:predicted membrane-bound dolichyl-phosphate-mannose-protein mannosyltransferase
MEILGIGMPELIFIVLIALIVLGPKDMEKTGRTIGVWLNKVVRSDVWRVFLSTSKEIGKLPNKWMRETNPDIAKWEGDVKKMGDAFLMWTGEADKIETPANSPNAPEKTVEPPSDSPAERQEEPHA